MSSLTADSQQNVSHLEDRPDRPAAWPWMSLIGLRPSRSIIRNKNVVETIGLAAAPDLLSLALRNVLRSASSSTDKVLDQEAPIPEARERIADGRFLQLLRSSRQPHAPACDCTRPCAGGVAGSRARRRSPRPTMRQRYRAHRPTATSRTAAPSSPPPTSHRNSRLRRCSQLSPARRICRARGWYRSLDDHARSGSSPGRSSRADKRRC